MVLSLGTWFFHVPFYLYDSRGFPGADPNPAWDRHNHSNAQFIATMFGFHILLNITISLLLFAVMRLVYLRIVGGTKGHVMFHRIPNDVSELEEESCLLEEEM
ncbi:uncharacterized protein LOC123547933 [Mercenaria mercenaria]|uniref:uncharacterized protein LOC123547933 n=1 Tax=Mercenaria mercenaria TaxID=6596 RepID=UPI00234E6400|nr:uncharacterized protein LOC123547933 [Mercenaria mercenaria]